MVLWWLMSSAQAGKLADGYRGMAWGAYQDIPHPGGQCAENTEPTVRWQCDQTIGEIPVKVSYGYKQGLFYAVIIRTAGYTNCDTLMDTLTIAWGPSRPNKTYAAKKLDDRAWVDGPVYAGWEHNQFNDQCQIAIINTVYMDAIKEKEIEKAKSGADEL